MKYLDLVEAMKTLRASTAKPHVTAFNCHKQTMDWLKDTFCSAETSWPSRHGSVFMGTPMCERPHLYPGYIEAVMSDGSREYIDLRKKATDTEKAG